MDLKPLEAELLAALSCAARDVLVRHLREHPGTEVHELIRLTSTEPFRQLRSMTIGDLLRRVELEEPTQHHGVAYDAAVLAALIEHRRAASRERERWLSATALAEVAGGGPGEVQAALRRLCIQGTVRRSMGRIAPRFMAVRS